MTKQELIETYTAEQLAEMVLYGEQIGEKLMDVITGGNKKIPVIFDKISRAETEGREGKNHKKTLIEKYQEEIDEWKKNHPYNTDERLEAQKLIKEIRRDENGIWLNLEDSDFIQNYSEMQKAISDNQVTVNELNCKVEKYRKAFENAKKERDCQIAEYRKKIEELYYSLKTLEGNLKVSNMIIEETIKNENGEDSNTVKFSSVKQFAEYIKCFYTVNLDYIQKVLQGNEESENNFENVTDFLPTEPIKVADMLINASKKRTNCMKGKGYDKYIFEKWQLKQIAEHLLIYCNHNGEEQE